MKIISFACMACVLGFVVASCEKSASDEFEDANGDVDVKLMQAINVTSSQDPEGSQNIVFTYNSDGTLNTVSDGQETTIFVYQDDELVNVAGQDDNVNTEDLYQSPYDAFEIGQVTEYDGNGNPVKITFLEEEYDSSTNDYVTKEYTAELSYDNAPNPFFYTMKAGKIIEVLDDVQLNFSTTPQSSDIVRARMLLPVNNLKQIVYRNEEGSIVYTITANYLYDGDYPTSTTVTAVDQENNEQGTYTIVFTYVD